MNLTAVLSLAVRKIVRYESIGDLIGAKLERGCRLKSRGRRTKRDRSSRSRSLDSIEDHPFGREPLSMSHRENILARNIKVPSSWITHHFEVLIR